jgi:hypothetical protein
MLVTQRAVREPRQYGQSEQWADSEPPSDRALNPLPPQCLITRLWERIMQASILVALAIVIGADTAAHAGCTTSTCPADEQPTNTEPGNDVMLKRRIENALNDLEIYNARASTTRPQAGESALEQRIDSALKDLEIATTHVLRTDQERQNALLRRSGIER